MRGLWYSKLIAYLFIKKITNKNIIKYRKKMPLEADDYAFERFNTIFRYSIKDTKTNVIISGGENIPKEPCVFLGNHQGNFDPFLISYAIDYVDRDRKVIYIAKKELSKIPVFSYWMKAVDSIFIDRDNPRDGIRALSRAAEKIKSGVSVVIFPEGTRNLGKEVKEFKSGGLRIAINAKCKVIPFVIDGSEKVMDVGKKLKGNTVKIRFLKPIDVSEYSKEELKSLDEKIRENVVQEIAKLRNEQ